MFWVTLLLLAVAYAPCSIGLSLPVKRKYRAVIALGLFFFAIAVQFVIFTGILPRIALLLVAWCSGVLIFSTPFFFLRDMVLLVMHLKKRRIPNQKYSIAVILILSGLLAAWGEYSAVTPPKVKPVEIAIPGLPDAFDGFRIVYITDTHISKTSSPNYLWTIVCRANAVHPDLVLLGGDLGDLKPDEIKPNMHQLGDLHGKYGVYSSPGNHEYFRGFDEWIEFLDSVGIETLLNRHIVIEKDGAQLVIAGLPDLMRGNKWFIGREAPDLDKTFEGAPEGAPVVLLSHQPRFARDYAKYPVSLQLSGHTHGGMIAGLPALLVKIANKGFVSGKYQVDDMTLYVSNGAGLWNGFMFRLDVPPEITEIILRKPKEAMPPGS
ncbi:MAG: metallophosphoesterase [Lentisphaeria bacterium]|nr:metallophosphoesterase [Lentisphaeria bacterium]MBR3688217.1 metallophosphoesterase [Lentisphaeria bacterium]